MLMPLDVITRPPRRGAPGFAGGRMGKGDAEIAGDGLERLDAMGAGVAREDGAATAGAERGGEIVVLEDVAQPADHRRPVAGDQIVAAGTEQPLDVIPRTRDQ